MGKYGSCPDCGTTLEYGHICSNCDEAAAILETQGEFVDNPSDEFIQEARDGYARAKKRAKEMA